MLKGGIVMRYMRKYFYSVIMIFVINVYSEENQMHKFMNMSLQELMNVEVTISTGTPVPLEKAPAVATVITKEMIEYMGATTLDEVLETIPGIHVFPSELNVFSKSYSIRGIHTSLNPHVLLLINGNPAKNDNNSSRPFGFNLPVSVISRIEVVKGPGSAVHGADSFAGTINVITKTANDIDGTKTGLRAGSFDTYSAWAEHGQRYGDYDVAFGVETMKSEGDDDRIVDRDYMYSIGKQAYSEAPGPLNTGYEMIVSHFDVQNQNWDINFFSFNGNDIEFGHSGIQNITEGSHNDSEYYAMNIINKIQDLFSNVDAQLKLFGSHYRGENYFKYYPESYLNMIGNPGFNFNTGGLDLTFIYTGVKEHKFRISSGASNTDVNFSQKKNFGPGIAVQFGPLVDVEDTPYVYMRDQNRQLYFFTLQDEWSMTDALIFTAGVRYDDYSDFGNTTNPRLALVWETSEKLTSKILYGTAFREPSFGEQNLQNNPLTIGNPSLEPEEIQTFELVFDYKWNSAFRSQLSAFDYNIEGLIEYIQDPGRTSKTAQNYRDQEGYGIEFESELDLTEKFKLVANALNQRSKDKDTDVIVPDVPETQVKAGFDWFFVENWLLDVRYFWIGNRHRAVTDTRDAIADYDSVNFTLRRKNIAEHFDFAIGIKNLFDSDIREPSNGVISNDYPMEGRSIFAEVRAGI